MLLVTHLLSFFPSFQGQAKLEEGRKVMFVEGQSVPMTIVKSDGGFTYDTSDMAAVKHRIEDEKGTWLIYVTDAGQVSVMGQVKTIYLNPYPN